MRLTYGLRKCIRPLCEQYAPGSRWDALRPRPNYYGSLAGLYRVTGFESAGFDRFAISFVASRPGNSECTLRSAAVSLRLWESRSDFQAWRILPGEQLQTVWVMPLAQPG